MNKLTFLMKASRFRVIPVMIIPVIMGAVGAYIWNDVFRPWLFLMTLIGAGAAHLFANLINDLWDFRNGVDTAAKESASAISTNSGFLASGALTESKFRFLTWSLFTVALLCGIALSLYSGWWTLVFAGLGGLIAYFYVAPPLRFGYRGKGYSEIAILLSFGILPVMGSYYVQTMQLDYRPLGLSLPIGLLTTLILFNHHFLHWQADLQAGKRTLVVVWGERKALLFSRFLCILAYLALVACVWLQILPVYALLALISAIPLVRVYANLNDTNSRAYLPLMGASLKATVRSGVILIVSMLVQAVI